MKGVVFCFVSDYPDYNNAYPSTTPYFANVKYEDDNDQEEEKYRIPDSRSEPPPYNYDSAQDY